MNSLLGSLLYNFLISLGMIIGAGLCAGLGAIINNHPPLKTMLEVANSIKIWAVAATIGGTFSTFEVFESGILKGEFKGLIKQSLFVLSALIGTNLGCQILTLLKRCSDLWFE